VIVNPIFGHDASGLTTSSQTFIDTRSAYDDLGRLVRSDLKKGSDPSLPWIFSSFTYDADDTVSDQVQNGQESTPGGHPGQGRPLAAHRLRRRRLDHHPARLRHRPRLGGRPAHDQPVHADRAGEAAGDRQEQRPRQLDAEAGQ
jgi:YD repeat-containing protein